MQKKWLSNSINDLENIAQELIKTAKENKIWAFYGEMGAGKTTFIKAICKVLNVREDNVSSPTYSLVNEYLGKDTIYHFDFYRLKNELEALDIGIEDYFYSGKLCLIEWPEKIPNLLPADFCKIEINVDANQNRHILLTI